MAYWLFKSEPGAWSWDDQVRDGTTFWDGVRNHQANNNMKAMKIGDLGFSTIRSTRSRSSVSSKWCASTIPTTPTKAAALAWST